MESFPPLSPPQYHLLPRDMLPTTRIFRALSETSSRVADDEMPPRAVEKNYKRNRRRWKYFAKNTLDHQLECLRGSWKWMWKNLQHRNSTKLGRAQTAVEKSLNKRRLRRKRRCLERRRKRVTRKGGPGQGRKQIRGMVNSLRRTVNRVQGIVNRIRGLMDRLRELQNDGHDSGIETMTMPEYDQGHDRFSTLLGIIRWFHTLIDSIFAIAGITIVILCIILRMVKWAAPQGSQYTGRFFSTGMPFRRFFDWLRG